MEGCARHTLGLFRKSHLRTSGNVIGNMDLAALAVVSSDATRYESGSRPSFPDGDKPTDRSWLALHGSRCRVSRLALLRGGGFRREESLVDRDAGHRNLLAARKLFAAPGRGCKRRRALPAE